MNILSAGSSKEQPSVETGKGAEEVVIGIEELLTGRVVLEFVLELELELVIAIEGLVVREEVLDTVFELKVELDLAEEIEGSGTDT